MNYYACTITYVGEAESADEFGDTLRAALSGDTAAQARITPTTDLHVVKLGQLAPRAAG